MNKEYITKLTKKNRIGKIIRLGIDNVHIWSMYNYNTYMEKISNNCDINIEIKIKEILKNHGIHNTDYIRFFKVHCIWSIIHFNKYISDNINDQRLLKILEGKTNKCKQKYLLLPLYRNKYPNISEDVLIKY